MNIGLDEQILADPHSIMEQAGYGHRVEIGLKGSDEKICFSIPNSPQSNEEWAAVLEELCVTLRSPGRKLTQLELDELDCKFS